jgi:oligopeptide transport system permease protein
MAETTTPGAARPAAQAAEPSAPLALHRAHRKQTSLWGDAWRRLRRNKFAVAGLVMVILLCLVALFSPVLAREELGFQNYDALYKAPERNLTYIFGADQLGRSILYRIIHGTRVSILVGLVAQLIVLAIGLPVGAIAGYFGGKTDLALMRIVDVMYAFPQLLFVILLMSMWGRGLGNIFLAIGLTGWVTLARLVRAQFLTLRERDYVVAARAIGADDMRLIVKHMLPNAMTPIIVAMTFGIPAAIFTEAFLSFIGVGIGPPMTSWGVMVGENQQYLRTYAWMLVWPAAAIGVTMLSFTFLGDGLRDALDPSLKRD